MSILVWTGLITANSENTDAFEWWRRVSVIQTHNNGNKKTMIHREPRNSTNTSRTPTFRTQTYLSSLPRVEDRKEKQRDSQIRATCQDSDSWFHFFKCLSSLSVCICQDCALILRKWTYFSLHSSPHEQLNDEFMDSVAIFRSSSPQFDVTRSHLVRLNRILEHLPACRGSFGFELLSTIL